MTRFSLRQRIAGLFGGLVLVALGGVLHLVLESMRAQLLEQAEQNLAVGERVFLQALEARSRQLSATLQVLANDFAFRRAVATGDSATISLALANHGERIDADLMVLHDRDHRLLASTLDHRHGAMALPAPVDSSGRVTDAFLLHGGATYQVVTVPVRAPRLIGWLHAGFTVDEQLTASLRNLTGLESVFSAKGEPLASSLGDVTPAALQALVDAAPDHAVHSINARDFLVGTVSISDDPPTGAFVLLPLDHLQVHEARLRFELIITFCLAIGVATTLAALFAGSIARPVNVLARAAQRIRAGDYDEQIDATRQDELGDLATTFNLMQRAIAAREEAIAHAAHHDQLTGLAARAIVDDRIGMAMQRSTRADQPMAVVHLNLHRFRQVNDAFGHPVGDEVLRTVASRLQDCCRRSDTVARLGADQFLLVLEATDRNGAMQLVERVLDSLRAPIPVDNLQVLIDASAGLSMFPEHGETSRDLLRRAELALGAAREDRQAIGVYADGQDEDHLLRITLATDLATAISDDALSLAYQPKVTSATGRVDKVEALLRWIHPEHGFISPEVFVALAEQTGLMAQLTHWVLSTALDQVADWRRAGCDIQVAVNISTSDLRDEGFPEQVDAMLAARGLPAGQLCLEVTESTVMHDATTSIDVLSRLGEAGITLSIDDFGTGHSSMAQLRRMPVHELKVDKAFIFPMLESDDDLTLVRAMIDMAHNMGLRVVAEGVEDQAVVDALTGLGCEFLQGYHFSRPLPAADLLAWIESRHQHQEVA